MSTETAQITGAKRDRLAKTGEEFLDVEVTYTLGETTEVAKYAYPLESTAKEIEKDLKAKLAARKTDREHAERHTGEVEAQAEATKVQAKADKTVEKLEGIKVK